ncbi:thioredoxin-like protein [Immersiella caudata]|uniref:Thioredoxin-like protein n=1 Tax=Immersiella caudata TaxID=314043 RepID=A0AA40BX83_9PEZI|nr:thioredoxin-like protein [Immersiella caudata]
MATLFNKLFRRKKPAPLVCSVSLDAGSDSHASSDHDHHHQHTSACFLPFEPLAILELFQSQGCASCPPAVPAIHEGASQPNILLLTYNVTLFDHLGWADTLADARWDARQRAYARTWGRNSLYAPMIVGNGSVDGAQGGGAQEVADVVARSRDGNASLGWKVYLDVNDTDARIDSDKVVGDDVYEIMMAVYDARPQKIKIKKGVNKGEKLEHRNVVTELRKVEEWKGGDATVALPVTKGSLPQGHEAVVFLQGVGGGRIVAAAKL